VELLDEVQWSRAVLRAVGRLTGDESEPSVQTYVVGELLGMGADVLDAVVVRLERAHLVTLSEDGRIGLTDHGVRYLEQLVQPDAA
jgi:hypothetical protein